MIRVLLRRVVFSRRLFFRLWRLGHRDVSWLCDMYTACRGQVAARVSSTVTLQLCTVYVPLVARFHMREALEWQHMADAVGAFLSDACIEEIESGLAANEENPFYPQRIPDAKKLDSVL